MTTENPHFLSPEEADVDTNDLADFARQRALELGYAENSETVSEPEQSEQAQEVKEEVEEVKEKEPSEQTPEEKPESKPSLSKRELRLLEQERQITELKTKLETREAQVETREKELEQRLKNAERTETEALLDPIGYLKSLGYNDWAQLVRDGYEEHLGDDASADYRNRQRIRQHETAAEKRIRQAEEKAEQALNALKEVELQRKYERYVGDVTFEVNNLDQTLFENVNTIVESHGADFVKENVLKIANWYADNNKTLITPKQALQVYERELEKLVGPLKSRPKVEDKASEPVVDDNPGTINNDIGSTRGSKTITDDYDEAELRRRAAAALFKDTE